MTNIFHAPVIKLNDMQLDGIHDVTYEQSTNGFMFPETMFGNQIARFRGPTETTVTFSGVSDGIGALTVQDITPETAFRVNDTEFRLTDFSLSIDHNMAPRYTVTLTNCTAYGNMRLDGAIGERKRRSLRVMDGPEAKARLLLKRLVGDTAFRNYLKNGFLSYRGKSGKSYQIFPGEGMTNVWENGRPMEKLCVIFNDYDKPPTDSVVMRLLLLENSEDKFKKLSNRFGFSSDRRHQSPQIVQTGRILELAARKARGEIKVQGSKIIIAA